MKSAVTVLTLAVALVAVSAFEASAQKEPSKRQRSEMTTPIPSCKGMDKTTQAYKDCVAERARADRARKEKKATPQ